MLSFRKSLKASALPDPAVDRLHSAIITLRIQGAELAKEIKAGGPLSNPVLALDMSGTLMQSTAADGTLRHDVYYYSDDLRSFDPTAQEDLAAFFGHVADLNEKVLSIVDSKRVRKDDVLELLDRVLVEAFYFDRWLSRRDITSGVLTGNMTHDALRARWAEHEAEDQRELDKVIQIASAAPETLDGYVPQDGFSLCVIAPLNDIKGATTMNGIWIPALSDHDDEALQAIA